MTEWLVDSDSVVHHAWCSLVYISGTPYGSLASDSAEMIAHLARPDVCTGHSAPSILAPCDQCLLGRSLDG